MQILNYLAASPLATTATFTAVHFYLSEAEYSSLVASSASLAQVVIEISTDPIEFTFFLYFKQVQFPPLEQDYFIDIHCFFCCITIINSGSGHNISLPPPQPAGLRLWGWLASIPLIYFPHLQQSQ